MQVSSASSVTSLVYCLPSILDSTGSRCLITTVLHCLCCSLACLNLLVSVTSTQLKGKCTLQNSVEEPWLEVFVLYLWFFFKAALTSCSFPLNRFEDDIQYMIGFRPHAYWRICWRYVSPFLISVILIASIINLAITPMTYSAWDPNLVSVLANFFQCMLKFVKTIKNCQI